MKSKAPTASVLWSPNFKLLSERQQTAEMRWGENIGHLYETVAFEGHGLLRGCCRRMLLGLCMSVCRDVRVMHSEIWKSSSAPDL